ncbi:MAG TPA: glycosyltransferase family 1 protein [Gemmatimonadales bacterium]|nr:glycosyltransferase family 1 protein [Gemmatimonadales bacterium]
MQSPPRVGIMLRHITAPGGVTVFTKRVVRYLLTHPDGIEYHLLYSHPSQMEVLGDLPAKHVVLEDPARIRWDQSTAPRYAERNGLALLMNCKFSVPLASSVPTLIVIPGREQLAMAHVFPWYNRWYNRLFVPAFCREATALITHTEIGREDCIMMGARPERIHVVPHGVDPYLRPAPEEAKAALRTRLGLSRPYILFLGGITPLKNIGNLLRAFGIVARTHDVDLVLAGFKRWSFEQELAPIAELGLQDRVKYVGYIPDEELAALYSAAACLALPSWYEGFGIPIVEAMACGCPVVTSSGRHAAPEVAGGAAVLVDPADPTAIAAGLSRVLDDPALRAELVAKGLVRGPQFDWNTTGRRTAEVIRSLVETAPRRAGALRVPARGVVRALASVGAVATERLAGGFHKK